MINDTYGSRNGNTESFELWHECVNVDECIKIKKQARKKKSVIDFVCDLS